VPDFSKKILAYRLVIPAWVGRCPVLLTICFIYNSHTMLFM